MKYNFSVFLVVGCTTDILYKSNTEFRKAYEKQVMDNEIGTQEIRDRLDSSKNGPPSRTRPIIGPTIPVPYVPTPRIPK